MFEAHYNQANDFQGIDTIETVATSWTKTYYRRHKLNFTPLTIWFAKGTRKANNNEFEERVFAYIEYQDAQGHHQNRHLELAGAVSVTEALKQAAQVDLGER